MSRKDSSRAVVVGSGPNGLAAAIELARHGLEVEVLEGASTPGGGCRSAAVTEAGFVHDLCSAVHPLLAESPFFREQPLASRGVELLIPEVALAHPLDGGRVGVVRGSVEQTAAVLGADDDRYRRLFAWMVRDRDKLVPTLLAPIRTPPKHPVPAARFAALGLRSARHLARRFSSDEARGIVAGVAAHSMLALDQPLTASFALLLTTLAHSTGWPLVRGGSSFIVDALVRELEELGGKVTCGARVDSLSDVGRADAVLFDVAPSALVRITGDALPRRYRRALERFRNGPGAFKIDYALSEAVPWKSPECRVAGTVHVGGSFEEVASAEADVAQGRHPDRPFCIVVQASVVDPSRAPAGRATLWAYCHVPNGSDIDMTGRIEAQIERFAPGFRQVIMARATRGPAQLEAENPNDVGGDIAGGSSDLLQTLFRPAVRWNPYRTPLSGVYLCSASTPPGGGVHGMCGMHAAQTALADLRRPARGRV
ncbi:MAG: NAD(P)/FAD-dependent oxidoreductase [Acidimicrobiales bacterium]